MSDRDGIQKLGRQHYRVQVDLLPDPITGKRRRISRTVRGPRAEAEAVRAGLLVDIGAGRLTGTAEQRLGDYLTSWLARKRGTIADRTWERYESLLRTGITPGLGNVKMRDLTPQRLGDFFAACRDETTRRGGAVSPATLHHRFVVLKTALAQAVREGVLTRNPLDMVDPPKRRRAQPRIVGESEAAMALTATEATEIGALAWLALHTGARLGELLALRWRDLDLSTGTLHICRALVEHLRAIDAEDWFDFKEPKSGHGRALDIDEGTAERLRAHRRAQNEARLLLGPAWRDLDLVFPNVWRLKGVSPGEPIRPSTVSRLWRQTADRCGLAGVRFHDLRHAHATILLRSGVAPHVVSRRLGHADVALTLRVYSHVLPGQEREAANAFAASLEKARNA